jgi:hypothetical protein
MNRIAIRETRVGNAAALPLQKGEGAPPTSYLRSDAELKRAQQDGVVPWRKNFGASWEDQKMLDTDDLALWYAWKGVRGNSRAD